MRHFSYHHRCPPNRRKLRCTPQSGSATQRAGDGLLLRICLPVVLPFLLARLTDSGGATCSAMAQLRSAHCSDSCGQLGRLTLGSAFSSTSCCRLLDLKVAPHSAPGSTRRSEGQRQKDINRQQALREVYEPSTVLRRRALTRACMSTQAPRLRKKPEKMPAAC